MVVNDEKSSEGRKCREAVIKQEIKIGGLCKVNDEKATEGVVWLVVKVGWSEEGRNCCFSAAEDYVRAVDWNERLDAKPMVGCVRTVVKDELWRRCNSCRAVAVKGEMKPYGWVGRRGEIASIVCKRLAIMEKMSAKGKTLGRWVWGTKGN